MAKTQLLIVKFRKDSKQAAREKHLRGIIGKDLVELEQVFPNAEEPGLESIVAVRVRGRAKVGKILEDLEQDDDVEYAHKPSEKEGLSR